jgi:hypothetical protein
MLIGLLIRKGSILKAKLRMAKRLNRARAVTIHLLNVSRIMLFFKVKIKAE